MPATTAHRTPDKESITELVHAFYADVRKDDLLGPVFDKALHGQWDAHLHRLVDFWSTVLLGTHTGLYTLGEDVLGGAAPPSSGGIKDRRSAAPYFGPASSYVLTRMHTRSSSSRRRTPLAPSRPSASTGTMLGCSSCPCTRASRTKRSTLSLSWFCSGVYWRSMGLCVGVGMDGRPFQSAR